ncbi:hypothetical protein BU15DRAFT_69118, partial [Melanogaster broomeanus]
GLPRLGVLVTPRPLGVFIEAIGDDLLACCRRADRLIHSCRSAGICFQTPPEHPAPVKTHIYISDPTSMNSSPTTTSPSPAEPDNLGHRALFVGFVATTILTILYGLTSFRINTGCWIQLQLRWLIALKVSIFAVGSSRVYLTTVRHTGSASLRQMPVDEFSVSCSLHIDDSQTSGWQAWRYAISFPISLLVQERHR